MPIKAVLACFALAAVLASCQSAMPAPIPTEPIETSAAATGSANQTSTAAADQARSMTLTAALPIATSTPASTATPSSLGYQVTVPANECWFPSGVQIKAGQQVTIFASGTVNTWKGKAGSDADPGGHPKSICGDFKCPMQGKKYGALIGRLEDGEVFLVGKNLKFTAPGDGQLYFTVNDWECSDNLGAFTLGVRIQY